MNPQEIINLLSIAAAFDNRKAGEAQVHAWTDSAVRARWTFTEAAEAIKDYYARTDDEKPWVMPSHITAHIRAARQDRAMREEAQRFTGLANPHVLEAIQDFADARAIPGPSTQRRAELIESVTGALPAPRGTAEVTLSAEQIRQAKRVPCPWCQARPFHECSRPSPRGDRRMVVPHPARVEAAEAAFGGVA